MGTDAIRSGQREGDGQTSDRYARDCQDRSSARERQSILTLRRSATFMNECCARESFVIPQRRTFLSSQLSLHSRLLVRWLRRRRTDERSRASHHWQPSRRRDFARPAEPLTHLAISRICRSQIERVARRRRFHELIDTNADQRNERRGEQRRNESR